MIGLLQKVSDTIDRFFHDRKIVVVSEHKTINISFSKNLQMLAVILVLLSIAWIPFSAGKSTGLAEFKLKGDKKAYSSMEERVDSIENDILLLEEYIKALHKFDNFEIEQVEDDEEDDSDAGGIIEKMESKRNRVMRHVQRTAINRIVTIENFLASSGFDYKKLTGKEPPTGDRQGGPYIPANLKDYDENGDNLMITTDFINELNYLFDLQKIMNYMPYSMPIAYDKVTSYYGVRRSPFGRGWETHAGLDLAGPRNSYIVATGPGKVTIAGRQNGYGMMVEVYHGYGITTRYGHMKTITVKKGQMVERGQVIGVQGCTGRCTGDHVHYEVRYNKIPINPLKFLNKSGKIQYYYAKNIE